MSDEKAIVPAAPTALAPVEGLEGELEAFRREADVVVCARRASEASRRGPRQDLDLWLAFCGDNQVLPRRPTLVQVTAFRDLLNAAPKARGVGVRRPGTVARILSVVSGVYEGLWRAGRVAGNPFSGRLLQRPSATPIAPASLILVVDFERMVAATGDSWRDHRDRAVLEVLYWTGWRRAEIARLRVEDLVTAGNGETTARLTLKGGDVVELFVARPAVAALEAWKTWARLTAGYLFSATSDGRRPLSPGAIYEILQRRAVQAGVTARIHPHGFRATAITDALDHVEAHEVQKLIGHRSIRSTLRYDRKARGQKAAAALEKARAPKEPGA